MNRYARQRELSDRNPEDYDQTFRINREDNRRQFHDLHNLTTLIQKLVGGSPGSTLPPTRNDPPDRNIVAQIESPTHETMIAGDIYNSDTDSVVSEPEFSWLNQDPILEDDTVFFDPD